MSAGSKESVDEGFSNPVDSAAVSVDENVSYNAHEGMVVTENIAYSTNEKRGFVSVNKETTSEAHVTSNAAYGVLD